MNLENDENITGFSVCIIFENGKASITLKRRLTAGEPLEVVSKDEITDNQLYDICALLDELP